jgi:phage-related protein (TIGR01555 family)
MNQSHRRVDAVDGYSPDNAVPASEQALINAAPGVVHHDGEGRWSRRSWLGEALHAVVDGYQNHLTGVGDPARDKSYGGHWNGPAFYNQFLTGWEAQERWRGSDLGGRIIETIPREMLRKGWKIDIQPDGQDGTRADSAAAQPHAAGPLPAAGDSNTALIEELRIEQEQLGLAQALELALCYERNYGGGAILLGLDDGETDLTRPVDWKRVRRIQHLTPYRGGWDGELIAWRYYVDPRDPKFGVPEIYQLRNLGIPFSVPLATGEPGGSKEATGTLVFLVHESRFLIFDGDPKSRWAAVQMRGWGDSLWIRVNQVLAQYCQSWDGVAVLLQELGSPILKMKDFDKFMSSQDASGMQVVTSRALAMQMAMSVAKVRILDTAESLERLPTQLAGVADVLREFALRVAAAAGMPFSMLVGQVQGGLGDASRGDISFFDDQIAGLQRKKLLPALRRFVHLQLAATEGATGGRVPRRWSVSLNPQREMSEQERADYRKTIADADASYIDRGVVTAEEVASTRFGAAQDLSRHSGGQGPSATRGQAGSSAQRSSRSRNDAGSQAEEGVRQEDRTARIQPQSSPRPL